MSPKKRERSVMGVAAAKASDLIACIAGREGSKKEMQLRAWRRLVARFPESSWTFNRVHDLFTRDPRARVTGDELLQLSEAAKLNETITLARHDYNELLDRLSKCEAILGLSQNDGGGLDFEGR